MPLRDHFRPPVERTHLWDELYGGWPAVIVQHLFSVLPDGYASAPKVHLGAAFEIDASTCDPDAAGCAEQATAATGGLAVAPSAPPAPTLTLEMELPDQDEYEVLVYDTHHGRRLVAAIELVSPGNKDRPESRRVFVANVAALLQRDVCVSIVDLVTVRQFSLYADVLALAGRPDLAASAEQTFLYAVTLRRRNRARGRPLLDTWYHPMGVGKPLPTLPLWLDIDVRVDLELEKSYEDTCRVLRIA